MGSRIFTAILLSPITLSIKLIKLICKLFKPLACLCWKVFTYKWIWTIFTCGMSLVAYKMLKYIYEKK